MSSSDLNPPLSRLTIVRKIDAGDGSYPSVNTCVHYLKVKIENRENTRFPTITQLFQLPDYSSEEVLKERLLAATSEKGFHLN